MRKGSYKISAVIFGLHKAADTCLEEKSYSHSLSLQAPPLEF